MPDHREQFNQGLQATASLVQSLIGEVRDNSVALAAFSAELKNIRENVNHLTKILKDGNGQESVMTRLSLVEKAVEELDEDRIEDRDDFIKKMDDMADELSNLKKTLEEQRKENSQERVAIRGQKFQFWGTIIVAVLALAAAALNLLK